MNNLSFKAKLNGVNSDVLKVIFEAKTKKDTKHEMLFVENPDKYGEDKFELYKNGEKTSEYYTDVNQKLLSIDRLIGIFNILKVKEAQFMVEKHKKNNR